jgi:hypothetical protein
MYPWHANSKGVSAVPNTLSLSQASTPMIECETGRLWKQIMMIGGIRHMEDERYL